MNNAIRIGLSKQVALKRQLSTVANNLANMSTPGFKTENLVFQEYLMPGASMENGDAGSSQLSYVSDSMITRDFAQGNFETTGNPLDLAINGEGWFTVEAPAGERYTRDGHFSINGDGVLVNINDYPVMVNGGSLTFARNETGISISKDGTISTSLGIKGRLDIAAFEDETFLKKTGDNLFSSVDEPDTPERISISQGMIEKSNVQPILQMTKMIEIQRAYEQAASMLDKMGNMKTDAINKLGQVAA